MTDPQKKIPLPKLIAELCPDGVEFKTLGEIGTFYGGLTGKNKEDFRDGNAKYITYMNVYSNLATNLNDEARVKVAERENQHAVKYGDVLFTGSSETPDECGMSSVVTQKPEEKIYLNSFCFGFRLNDPDAFCPDFLKHLFRSSDLREQIFRSASGVTRFNVSKKRFANVTIPIPPIEVQREIVRILDKFTELGALLETELVARKKQYEYYRDKLLTFATDVPRVALKEIVTKYTDGMHNLPAATSDSDGFPILSAQNINNGRIDLNTLKFVTEAVFKTENKRTDVKKGDVLLTIVGAIGRVAVVNSDLKALFQRSVCVIKPNNSLIYSEFLKYALESSKIQKYIQENARGAAQRGIYLNQVGEIKIPLPPLAEQKGIADILDRFDSLCNDLTSGIPAEIAARKKQYEYYRDRLLTFREKIS